MALAEQLKQIDREEKAVARLANKLAAVMHPVLYPVEQQCMQIQARNHEKVMRLARRAARKFVKGGA